MIRLADLIARAIRDTDESDEAQWVVWCNQDDGGEEAEMKRPEIQPTDTVYREHKFEHENFPPHIDEFQFCDEDIREAFEGTSYIIGSPLTVQLAREIRKLREVLEALTKNKADNLGLDTRGCYGYGGWGKW